MRNIQTVHVLSADQLNAYDVVVSDDIIFTKGAFDSFVSAKTTGAKTNGAKTNGAKTDSAKAEGEKSTAAASSKKTEEASA